ncbi:MAG: glycosyltransferase [Rhodospirillales bacterium]|nr:glycosyltransferase [Rhodospirillales bacterium]
MLAAAPIFVSPSLYEPYGLTVLEAAQAGAALVLADIPSFRELWSDAALFFSARNAAALAAAANRLIDDPALRARLGLAARERAADYTIERTVEGMERLYRQVTERRVGAVAVA